MKNKKPTQKEMIETLGRALMSFAMCRDKGVEAPEFNGTGFAITFMSGRDNMWMEMCSKFAVEAKDKLVAAEQSRAV